jgi:hypothetical protein
MEEHKVYLSQELLFIEIYKIAVGCVFPSAKVALERIPLSGNMNRQSELASHTIT